MSLLDIFRNKKTENTNTRKYEAASKGPRLARWLTTSNDANSVIEMDLPTLRNRSRYLTRNSAYARRGVDLIANNVVGKGIKVQFKSKEIQKIWDKWSSSRDFDYDGVHNINSMQRLLMASVVEGGDVIVRKRVERGSLVPLSYQLLEGDFLDTSLLDPKASVASSSIMQGIEYSSSGKIAGYHVYECHPGSINQSFNLKSNFISKDHIKHILRVDRPGQVRGVPWLSPVMVKIKDLDDYEDAQLVRQKIAACFTGFVQDISADVECDEDDSNSKDSMMEKIEPGIIEHLPPGKTIQFVAPPTIENYKEFTSAQLRAVSVGLGVSYETLSGDLSDVNFSAGRMGWIEMHRNIEVWRENIIIAQFLAPTVNEFLAMLSVLGVPGAKDEQVDYISPRREMIDPTKEIPAAIKAVRAGFESRENMIASMGRDADSVDASIKLGNDKADAMGFVFDSDPRKTTLNGKTQESGQDNDNTDGESDDNQD